MTGRSPEPTRTGSLRLVVLGADGLVGWELQRALAPLGDVVALGHATRDGLCGDLEDASALSRTLTELRPDVVVNAAGYTDVDGAERDAERAERVNAEGPRVLAAEACRLGAWLVHYSTDYVFDGHGSRPWQETDAPAPLNVYGRTKLGGERAVQASGCRHLIFRTQWLYAARGKCFVRRILSAALEHDALRVVTDEIGAPTAAELVADVTAQALRSVLADEARGGLYHLAARGETSWHGLARFVVAEARRSGWPVRVGDEAIHAVTADSLGARACRPRNGRLETARLEQAFDLRMPEWRSGVARVLAELAGAHGL